LVEEVKALKSESGRDMIAFGGAGFASSLVANDLVDEYQFYVKVFRSSKSAASIQN
jgi:dihydrofolate reductase